MAEVLYEISQRDQISPEQVRVQNPFAFIGLFEIRLPYGQIGSEH